MRTLLVCAAAALTLAACQRNAEEAVETPTDDASMDAAPAEGASGAGTTSAPARASAARAADEASADTAVAAPMDDGAAASSPVSESTRDEAKAKAEATNLHPRT